MSLSSDPAVPAQAVALTVSVSGDSATVTATEWILILQPSVIALLLWQMLKSLTRKQAHL